MQANYASNLSSQEKARKASTLDYITKASYVVAHKFTKHSKPFAEGEFVKECMVDIVLRVKAN
jgi:hypothetical protein